MAELIPLAIWAVAPGIALALIAQRPLWWGGLAGLATLLLGVLIELRKLES